MTLSSLRWDRLSQWLMHFRMLPLLSRNSSENCLRYSRDPFGLSSALTFHTPSTQTSSSLFAIPRIAWLALLGRRSLLSVLASSRTRERRFSQFSGPRLPPVDSSSVIRHRKFTVRSDVVFGQSSEDYSCQAVYEAAGRCCCGLSSFHFYGYEGKMARPLLQGEGRWPEVTQLHHLIVPLPRDTITLFVASTVYPVVGGRLTMFLDAWTTIVCLSVLSIVRNGVALPFLSPSLSCLSSQCSPSRIRLWSSTRRFPHSWPNMPFGECQGRLAVWCLGCSLSPKKTAAGGPLPT